MRSDPILTELTIVSIVASPNTSGDGQKTSGTGCADMGLDRQESAPKYIGATNLWGF